MHGITYYGLLVYFKYMLTITTNLSDWWKHLQEVVSMKMC